MCDVRGDVCDAAMLDGALRSADPDIVIHLATHSPRGDGAARASGQGPRRGRSRGRRSDRTCAVRADGADRFPDALSVAPDFGALAANGAEAFAIHCPEPIGGGDFATQLADANGSCAPACARRALWRALARDRPHAGRTGRSIATGRSGARRRFDARYAPQNVALGWSPLLDADEAVAWTREWRRAFESGADMRAVTLEQVDRYLGQRVRLTSPFAETDVGSVHVAA